MAKITTITTTTTMTIKTIPIQNLRARMPEELYPATGIVKVDEAT
jgi:hypothetical protein